MFQNCPVIGWVNGIVDPLLESTFGVNPATFDSHGVLAWTRDHAEVPVFFVFAYLAIIFQGPGWLKACGIPPMKLKLPMAMWNFVLSVFSFVGLVNTVPILLDTLVSEGFKYTVCSNPFDWYLKPGHPSFYVFLFVYSKIPELMDTVFLVLKDRPVIFLHWFHHLTVLLYCWHAYYNTVGPGIWFAGMNYTVHSIMYMYYGIMSLGVLKGFTKSVAPFITTIQISQMIVGMGVTYVSAYWHMQGGTEECFVIQSNYRMGLAMYTTYFVLFCMLFKKLYFGKGKHAKGAKDEEFCGVKAGGDAAGNFMGNPDKKNKDD